MWDNMTNLIINYLEGGYYHPDMKSKLKGGDNLGNSGETMFGFDRKASGDLVNTDNGREFWRIVDSGYINHHADVKYYNDKADGKLIAASVGQVLRSLISKIMQIQFNKYAAWLSPAAKQLVMASPALLFQFFYACWNGPGRFQTFANLVNAAVANGTTAAAALYKLVDNNRRSWGSWAAQRADTINEIINKHLGGVPSEGSGGGWVLIAAAAALTLYLIVKK